MASSRDSRFTAGDGEITMLGRVLAVETVVHEVHEGEITMSQRLDPAQAAPEAIRAMRALQAHVNQNGLDKLLHELVKIRASQMNGCAFCLAMHIDVARKHGEAQARIDMLPAWAEAGDLYTPRERAALAFTEAVTRIGEAGVPDAVYGEAARHFSAAELVELALMIAVINGWNRLMATFRVPPAVAAPARAA
jgi:AhpD family alkylhydroperoxidase